MTLVPAPTRSFENWNPSWHQNANTSYTHNASIALVRKAYPSWTDPAQIEAEAKTQFEAAALKLLVTTAQAVRKLRPKLKIGFYSFPTREYWCGCELANRLLRPFSVCWLGRV